MIEYNIRVHSCKKDTNVKFYLTKEQLQLVQEIAVATQLASQSECEPTVFVEPITKLKATKPEEQADV